MSIRTVSEHRKKKGLRSAILWLLALATLMAPVSLKAQIIIRETFTTHAVSQKEITFLLRLPMAPDKGDYRQKNVLPAFVLWHTDPDKLEMLLRGMEKNALVNYLLAAADAEQLPVLCWTRGGRWNKTASTEELDKKEARVSDREFDEISREWKAAVGKLAEKYRLPLGRMYLMGMSAGGQYAHRLALRTPESFLGVHIHIPSSFDKPVPAGASLLWLITTGEKEPGALRAADFYHECVTAGYRVVFKMVRDVGHGMGVEPPKLGALFLQYARTPQAMVRQPPPFIGDFVNHKVYPSAKAQWLPREQMVALPTKEIAAAWGTMAE